MKSSDRRSFDRDSGETLVELLLAVLIISISVSAILGSLIESTSASVTHRSLTTLDTVLKSFAESTKYAVQLKPSGSIYSDCVTPTTSPYVILGTPNPATVTPGTPVTIFATGFATADLDGVYVGTTPATVVSQTSAPAGSIGDAITFQVPPAMAAGSYAVTATYGAASPPSSVTAADDLIIQSGSPIDTASTLAGYGLGISDVSWWNSQTQSFDPSTGPCAPADRSGVQLLTLKGTAPDGTATTLALAVSSPLTSAPVFVSSSSTAFTYGTANQFQVTVTGHPTPTLSETGALPSGVTFDATTGILSGTPTSSGVFPITFSATNDYGGGSTVTQSFTLTVTASPRFTSASSTSFATGSADSFQVTASGYPSPTFSEAGALPAGVTFSSSGLLSGTPPANANGTYSLTLTAVNTSGSATQAFTLTVGTAPAITSPPSTTFTAGSPGTFQFQASGYPTPGFSYTGSLPNGVTISASGLMSGTPAAGTGGSYPINVTATNSIGNSSQAFTLTVDEAPSITSPASATFTAGTAGTTFQVTASGYPAPTFTETGALPTGLTLSSSGLISGTPDATASGSYPISITAQNSSGTSSAQSFTIYVRHAPTVTNTTASFASGSIVNYQIPTTGYPSPTFTYTGTLPSGLQLSSSGVISGTPASNTTGSYPISLKASNGISPDWTGTFTITITGAPVITNPSSTANTVSVKKSTTGKPSAFTYTVTATGNPSSFAVTPQPPSWLSFNPTTGLLSGTAPTSTGSFTLTFTATNSYGTSAPQQLTISVVS